MIGSMVVSRYLWPFTLCSRIFRLVLWVEGSPSYTIIPSTPQRSCSRTWHSFQHLQACPQSSGQYRLTILPLVKSTEPTAAGSCLCGPAPNASGPFCVRSYGVQQPLAVSLTWITHADGFWWSVHKHWTHRLLKTSFWIALQLHIDAGGQSQYCWKMLRQYQHEPFIKIKHDFNEASQYP